MIDFSIAFDHEHNTELPLCIYTIMTIVLLLIIYKIKKYT